MQNREKKQVESKVFAALPVAAKLCSQPLTWHTSQPMCLFCGLETHTWPAGTGRETASSTRRAASGCAALAACPAPGQGVLRARARDILLLLPQGSGFCPVSANPSLLPAHTAPAQVAVHILQPGQQAMEKVKLLCAGGWWPQVLCKADFPLPYSKSAALGGTIKS